MPPLVAFVGGFFVPTWYRANLKRQKEERAEEQARQAALDDGR